MIRIMLYNIYKGGAGRLPIITEIVRDARPDILCLLETVGWGQDNQARLKSFSKEVGLQHTFLGKANTKYDMALISNSVPAKAEYFVDKLWHTVILGKYQIHPLGEVGIFVVHLNPKSEDERLSELHYILRMARQFEHVILAGDFNSLSPRDPYDKKKLLTIFQKQGLEKFGITSLRFDCIRLLENEGLVDVMNVLQKSFRATVPTPVNTDKAHAVPLRLDYIFVSAQLTSFISNAKIVHTRYTDQASDHYPVVVDFEFDIK